MNIDLKELKNCVIIDEWIYRDIILDNYKLREIIEKEKDKFFKITNYLEEILKMTKEHDKENVYLIDRLEYIIEKMNKEW